MNQTCKQLAAPLMTILLVLCMCAAAELTGNQEILFPEIAAIAAGALLRKKAAWNTDGLHILGMIAAGAFAGVLIVRFLPLPHWMQMSTAFLLALLMLRGSRCGFAPAISAIVLPVMLGTETLVYPAAAICLTGAILLLRKAAVRLGVTEPFAFTPQPRMQRRDLTDLLLCWAAGTVLIAFAMGAGFRYLAAPPLLVAFTECRKPDSGMQKHPVAAVGLMTACAAAGSLMRMLALRLTLPLFPAAGVTILLVILLMRRTGLWLPPAAALSILAFLIPAAALPMFAVQICIGAALLVGTAVLHTKLSSAIARRSGAGTPHTQWR